MQGHLELVIHNITHAFTLSGPSIIIKFLGKHLLVMAFTLSPFGCNVLGVLIQKCSNSCSSMYELVLSIG